MGDSPSRKNLNFLASSFDFGDESVAMRRQQTAQQFADKLETIINQKGTIPADVFSNALNIVFKEFDVPIKKMEEEIGVTHATINRWKSRDSLPLKIARKAVFIWLIEVLRKETEQN